MASDNAAKRLKQRPKTTSDNTRHVRSNQPDDRRTPLPPHLEDVHDEYVHALRRAPVSDDTRRAYASRVRQYLAWLNVTSLEGDPLSEPAARDWAMRDYRVHLQKVAKRAPATINTALAALDDFYVRRGIGPGDVRRLDLAATAPRALDRRETTRWLRAVESCSSARDRALALTPFYSGLRIGEVVALDVDDVQLSARKGVISVRSGKGDHPREVPVHAELRSAISGWLAERGNWPGAGGQPLFLNARGGRLSTRGARDVFARIGEEAGLDDGFTSHVLRHTFATTLTRSGVDVVLVADLLGHARLDTTRRYALPSAADRAAALEHLPVDK